MNPQICYLCHILNTFFWDCDTDGSHFQSQKPKSIIFIKITPLYLSNCIRQHNIYTRFKLKLKNN